MATQQIENIQELAQQNGQFCSPELILNDNPSEQWWVVTDEGEVMNVTREKIDGASRTLALLADKGSSDYDGHIPESRAIPVFRLFGGLWLRTGYTRKVSVAKVVRINADGTATVFRNTGLTKIKVKPVISETARNADGSERTLNIYASELTEGAGFELQTSGSLWREGIFYTVLSCNKFEAVLVRQRQYTDWSDRENDKIERSIVIVAS